MFLFLEVSKTEKLLHSPTFSLNFGNNIGLSEKNDYIQPVESKYIPTKKLVNFVMKRLISHAT